MHLCVSIALFSVNFFIQFCRTNEIFPKMPISCTHKNFYREYRKGRTWKKPSTIDPMYGESWTTGFFEKHKILLDLRANKSNLNFFSNIFSSSFHFQTILISIIFGSCAAYTLKTVIGYLAKRSLSNGKQ